MHTSVIFATLNGLFFLPTACVSLFTYRGLLLNGPQCSGNKGLKIHGIMMFLLVCRRDCPFVSSPFLKKSGKRKLLHRHSKLK